MKRSAFALPASLRALQPPEVLRALDAARAPARGRRVAATHVVPSAPPPDWQADGRLMEHHVDTYRHRRAVERAARKHGARLGDSYRVLLAIRLRLVDVDRDGAAPSLVDCLRLVDRWALEGRAPR